MEFELVCKKIEELITASIDTGILNIESLTAHAHLSPRQFNRKIKAIIGFRPARFIKEVQLQKVREELENGEVFPLKKSLTIMALSIQKLSLDYLKLASKSHQMST